MRGTVSAAPGELAEERLYCVEDAETGVGVFVLAQAGDTDLARGDIVTITGTLLLRRQALTLSATSMAEVDAQIEPRDALIVEPPSPGPWAWEPWEGQVIQVSGAVSGAMKDLTGGSHSFTLRLPGGGELLVGIGPRVLGHLPAALLASKMEVIVRGVLHQRSGSAGGGYRLWALWVGSNQPSTPISVLPSVGRTTPPIGGGFGTMRLLPGTPSIAMPREAQPWWARRIAEAITVWEWSLTLVGVDGPGLVVLPTCGEAQSVPVGFRAGGMVDRAGRAPYPQLR